MLIDPLKRLSHGVIIVVNKGQNLSHELIKGGKGASSKELTDQNTEPDFDLVEPRAMLGGVMKDDAMRGIAEKSGPSLRILQDTGLALLAQVNRKIGLLGHPSDQGFGKVNIEIVDHKMPAQGGAVSGQHRLDMGQKIDFRARGTGMWGDDLAGDDIAGQNESGRAVPDILKLAPLYFARCER